MQAELSALDKPGKRVTELGRVLAARAAPAYDAAAGSGGELEAKLHCADESERCPTVIVVTPSGNVISPWTPAARGGAVTTSNLGSGTYRTPLIGGEPDAACEVTVRAFSTTRKFSRPRGGAQTIAATSVTFLRCASAPSRDGDWQSGDWQSERAQAASRLFEHVVFLAKQKRVRVSPTGSA